MKKKNKIDGCVKVGRITMTLSKKAHIKSGDIMIDSNHILHINQKHKSELNSLGISAIDFVKIIVTTFSEIRKADEHGALYLIKKENPNPLVAVISLNFNIKKDFWEVKTAFPSRKAAIKSELIWEKGANPLRN